jgi:hypothetical protein
MLVIQKRNKYIEKAVQLPNGEWALVVFELIEKDGKIIARAVSGKRLSDIEAEQGETLCLPCVKALPNLYQLNLFSLILYLIFPKTLVLL